MNRLIYVLTMTDSHDDYNNGVFNAAFSSYEKAKEELIKWVDDEVNDGIIRREDLVFNDEKDFFQTNDGRFGWIIDELEVK